MGSVSPPSTVELSNCGRPCRVTNAGGCILLGRVGTAVHQGRGYVDDEVGSNPGLLTFWKTNDQEVGSMLCLTT